MLLDLKINHTFTFSKSEEKRKITKTTWIFFLAGISWVTKIGLWDAWQGLGVQVLAEKFSLFHSTLSHIRFPPHFCHLHVVQGLEYVELHLHGIFK